MGIAKMDLSLKECEKQQLKYTKKNKYLWKRRFKRKINTNQYNPNHA